MGEAVKTIPNPETVLSSLGDILNANTSDCRAFAEGVADGQKEFGADLLFHGVTHGGLDLLQMQTSSSEFARKRETEQLWAAGALIGSIIARREIQ